MHIGVIIVLAVVFLVVAGSLGRSIRRTSRMNSDSADYAPLDPGADSRHHSGGPHHGQGQHGASHQSQHGGHFGGGGHVGGGGGHH